MPRPKILFLAHLLPWPLAGGGQIKSYHTLRALSERYDVTLYALIRSESEREHTRHLDPLCAGGMRLVRLPRSRFSNVSEAVRAVLQNQSFVVGRDLPREMKTLAMRAFHSTEYAAIHVDHLQMMPNLPFHRLPRTRIVLDQHNVEHRIIRRLAEAPDTPPLLRWYAGIEWRKLLTYERIALARAEIVLAVSDEDRAVFLEILPDIGDKIETVPIGTDTEYFALAERAPDATTILSIGTMSWLPNVDAIRWFATEILPLVRGKKSDVRVQVVGANPANEIVALGKRDPGVVVTGTVPDVRPYAKGCGVFVVPLRSGSGVRVKILNALSMGLPVVSTSIGAEGIAVTHGENILIADTPWAFADAVCRVLSDRPFADRLGANGRALVEAQYTWDAVGARLHAVYERVLGTEPE